MGWYAVKINYSNLDHLKYIVLMKISRWRDVVVSLIDFNGMSTRLELFYTERLGNCVHGTFMFSFFVLLFLGSVCAVIWYQVFLSNTNNFQSHLESSIPIWYEQFLTGLFNTSRILTGTTNLGQSGSGSSGNEGELHTP